MLRPLLLVLAAAAAFFGLRSFFIRIGVHGTTQRIRMDCGDKIDYAYPDVRTTQTFVVKVLQTCGAAAAIRVGTPGDPGGPGEWENAQASLLAAGVRTSTDPVAGTVWLVSVPRGKTLRLECPPGDGTGCEFEFTPIPETGRSSTTLFTPAAAAACGAATATRIYNRSAQPVKIRIEWTSVCVDANGRATAPSVTLGRIDPPAGGVEPPVDTTRAQIRRQVNPGDPAALWQKDVDPGRTIDVTCGPGVRGNCSFSVSVITGARDNILGP